MNHQFKVKARTLTHLGAELITTDTIALSELIKNAFDAGSKEVRIDFNVPVDPLAASKIADSLDREDITLTTAINQLKNLVADDLAPNARTKLLNEIGELQSLSNREAVKSIRTLANSHCTVQISDWGVGMSDRELIDVFLTIGTPVKLLEKKTSDSVLLGDKGIGRLSMMRLGKSAVVRSRKKWQLQPHEIRFDWTLFDDPDALLEDIPLTVRAVKEDQPDQASGTTITISRLNSSWGDAEIKTFVNYLRRLQDPFDKQHRRFPIKIYRNGRSQPIGRIHWNLVESAQFQARYQFDPNDSIALKRTLQWKGDTQTNPREWSHKNICGHLSSTPEQLRSLGPLRIGCYWYNRSQLSHPTGEWDANKIRAELNVWSGGFAQYRDGFRIGLTGSEESDWMQLSATAIRGSGFRANNIQTIGVIAFSQKDNPALIDSANREGLVDCAEFRLLTLLMKEIVVKDLKFAIERYAEEIKQSQAIATTSERSIKNAEDNINTTLKNIRTLAREAPQHLKSRVTEIQSDLKQHVDYIKVARKTLELAKEQKLEILELAGRGMSVEIVVHELSRATQRIVDLLHELSSSSEMPKLEHLIESIESQVVAVNKRLRTIDPLSPSGRNRKTRFDLVGFIRGILDGYEPRFRRHKVTVELTVDGKPPSHEVSVRLVQGFVAQVIENLLSNSMYWLVQDNSSPIRDRRIEIDIDKKGRYLEVTDNGPGIGVQHIEDVFSPYFSFKKNGKGLGLYIARQLAEYHGGKLYLSPDGTAERLHTFITEFPKS